MNQRIAPFHLPIAPIDLPVALTSPCNPGIWQETCGQGAMLRITDQITIEDWEMTESFSRSSGPGGQNVNKVSTAVELRFEAARSPNLPDAVKARLRRIAGQKWTRDGAVVIRVEDTRSQARNREIARERLAELIQRATHQPKRRIATRPTLGSKRRRLDSKKARGAVKTLRGKVRDDGQ